MRFPGIAGERPSGRDLATTQFAITAFTLLLVVTTVGLFALHRVARDQALREATRLTRLIAASVIAPEVDRSLLAGDPASVSRLDALLHDGVIGDIIVRVKLWTPGGRIVYSDEHRLIGQDLPASAAVVEVARTGRPQAAVSDLDGEENSFERGRGDLLEVYVPVTAVDGTRFVAETYQATGDLTAASNTIWRSFLPVLLLALVALALAQLPLAWWYGRWSRNEVTERVELMTRAELARADERSRIAADLHDGVVQDLAGIAFDLAANADQVHSRSPQQLATALRHGADVSRASITQLRTLLVQLHPGEPSALDLARALPELAAHLRQRGVTVDVDIEPITIDEELRSLLYRAAQEGLRNVARHAAASRATISLTESGGVATLLIEDDGQGMTAHDLVEQRAAGHVGLTLLADRVRTRQGELTISSEPGRGTRLVVWLPLEPRQPPGQPSRSTGPSEATAPPRVGTEVRIPPR
jgi:two-component system, NarL family, sensor kinase